MKKEKHFEEKKINKSDLKDWTELSSHCPGELLLCNTHELHSDPCLFRYVLGAVDDDDDDDVVQVFHNEILKKFA